MEKQTKITFILFVITVVSAFVHNIFYMIFRFEEPIFFSLTIAGALAFAGSVVYNIILYRTRGKPEDIWKLGFLGLVGLLGLIPEFTGFFGFLAFLVFLG